MPKALLLVNPGSKSGQEKQEETRQCLKAMGFHLIAPSFADATDFASLIEKNKHSVDQIIVAGGDGSVNCAALGAYRTGLPLGIVPLGTANNLAKSLGIPVSIEKACQIIANGKVSYIDLAKVNGYYFVSVAGLGLSTEVHKKVSAQVKKILGAGAYALRAVQSLWKPRGFQVELSTESEKIRTQAIQVTVCNAKYYGGFLQIRSDANAQDALLDVVVIQTSHPLQGVLSILRKKAKGITRISGRKIEIKTFPPMGIDVEGSPCTQTPATFEVINKAVGVYLAS